MRILFAIKSLNVPGGGAERVLTLIANALFAKGHETVIVTFDGPGESFYRLEPGIRRIDLNAGQSGSPVPRWVLLRTFPKLRAVLKREQPDVVVAFMHSMYIPIGVSAMGCRIPIVASEHVGSAHFKSRLLERTLVQWTGWLFESRTAPTGAVARELQHAFGFDFHILNNPVDFSAVRSVPGLVRAEGAKTILCVGRFMAEKDHETLIRAFARVLNQYPEWRLRLVGEGELRDLLLQLVEELDLTHAVEFAGTVKNMAAEYSAATLVVVPSRYEAFGLVTAEAMASGKAVIGFDDCEGNRSLIKHGETGWLVSGVAERDAVLATAICDLIGDPNLMNWLAANAPKGLAHYDISHVVEEWEKFLMERYGEARTALH